MWLQPMRSLWTRNHGKKQFQKLDWLRGKLPQDFQIKLELCKQNVEQNICETNSHASSKSKQAVKTQIIHFSKNPEVSGLCMFSILSDICITNVGRNFLSPKMCFTTPSPACVNSVSRTSPSERSYHPLPLKRKDAPETHALNNFRRSVSTWGKLVRYFRNLLFQHKC